MWEFGERWSSEGEPLFHNEGTLRGSSSSFSSRYILDYISAYNRNGLLLCVLSRLIHSSHGQGKWTGNAETGRARLIILLSVESLLVALMDRGRTTTMAINFKYNRPMSHWLLWFVGRHWWSRNRLCSFPRTVKEGLWMTVLVIINVLQSVASLLPKLAMRMARWCDPSHDLWISFFYNEFVFQCTRLVNCTL